MKIKSYLLTALFAVTLISCSKDDATTTDANSENKVLSFNSEKEMQNKIAEITIFKKAQEAQIIENLLKRNHLEAPSLADLETLKNSNAQIDEKAILEDLKIYHNERLNGIYAERAHFNFTSIQSIADEINSLTLLNPSKASELFNKYAPLLKTVEALTSPVFDNDVALVMNGNGKLILKNEVFTPKQNNEVNSKLLVAGDIKQGILATNGFFSVTWHVGVSEHKDDLGHAYYGNFTQFGGFVNNVLFPTWFYPVANSKQNFVKPGTINPVLFRIVAFPTSAGTIVRTDDAVSWNKEYWNKYVPTEGAVAGTFVTIINGQFVTISGSKTIN
ncbi:hypothetical protein [Flavobacterium sp.]|uniref:hypothetical protein n=1 Tax=Flavobacterium sp. TaxID=239 RepID=UPI003D6A688E